MASRAELVRQLFGGSFRISRWYIPGHDGIDLPAKVGTPVYALAAGRVSYAHDARLDPNALRNWAKGGGNTVNIDIDERYTTQYAHLQRMVVKPGQNVAKGQLIGYVGSTGGLPDSASANFGAGNAHVHFGLWDRKTNRMVEPTAFLTKTLAGGPTPFGETSGEGDAFLARLKALGINTTPTHTFTQAEAERIVTALYPGVSGGTRDAIVRTYTGKTVQSFVDAANAGTTTSTSGDPFAALGTIAELLGKLADPANWVRILALFAGAIIFGVGALGVLKATGAPIPSRPGA